MRWNHPALLLAVELGNHTVIERLIIEGADLDYCCERVACMSALSITINNQDECMITMLIAAWADPNLPNLRLTEDRPLAIATKKGDMHMVHILLDHGADPNNSVALQNAASLDWNDMLDLILAHYCKVYLKPIGRFGSSTLKTGVLHGNESHIITLLKSGMDPKALVWDDGEVLGPFGAAMRHVQPSRNDIVTMFLETGCDPSTILVTFSPW
jgi:hypothetical protein